MKSCIDKTDMAESCKPCEEDNKKTASDGFCRECEEHMCQTCFQHHLKFRNGRNHEFLPKEHMNSYSIKRVDLCEKHDKQSVTYYCRKHDQVGCGDCMLFDGHNECQPEHIKRLASNIQEQEEFKNMIVKLETLSSQNDVNAEQLLENRRNNRELTDKLLKNIEGFRAMVNTYFDKAEADIKARAEKICKESDELLKTLEDDCCSTDTTIKECQQKLSSTHFPDHTLFINLVSIKTKLFGIEEKIKKTKESTKIERYIFKADTKLTEAIDSQRTIGTLEKVVEKATIINEDTRKKQNNNEDGSEPLKTIQIFIKTCQNNRNHIYTVTPTDTIKTLKKKINDVEGIPSDKMLLQTAFTGKILGDEFKICDYDIHDGSTVNCRLFFKPEQDK